MKGKSYALGLDFGTNSARALLVDTGSGEEIADAVANYPSGKNGIILDRKNHLVARQHPKDWLAAMTRAVHAAVRKAKKRRGFHPENIIGIGIDTTGSTPLPITESAKPLASLRDFSGNLNALAWLWKDHSSYAETEQIIETAKAHGPKYLEQYGGRYYSEWFWAKALHCRRAAPAVFRAAYTWVEASDWLPAMLCGVTKAADIKRNICAAGHKAMFNRDWDGYPEFNFLARLDIELAELRDRLPNIAHAANQPAGRLVESWAKTMGLRPGLPVAVGSFDAHCGGVGSGIKPGRLVKIIGTSTCDMMVAPASAGLKGIPGIPGVVPDSIIPGFIGIEAGQSAVGDLFNWFVNCLELGRMGHDDLTQKAKKLCPGETGLLALDWNNGNRSVLMDAQLSGLLLGQSLRTTPAEIYRALIEATAFGARVIVERLESSGQKVDEVVCCGGISEKNDLLLQIYADVIGRPMKLAASAQACALGAAIFGAVVAGKEHGGFDRAEDAQSRMCRLQSKIFRPHASARAVYDELFELYLVMHNAMGGVEKSADLGGVMKKLLELKSGASNKI